MKRYGTRARRVGLALALLLATGGGVFAATTGSGESHFNILPALEGTPEESNTRVREWLLNGFNAIANDMQKLTNDKALNADAIARFRVRLKNGETIGAPVEAALTNAQSVISGLEGLLNNPRINADTRRQTELNIAATQQQLELLLLNQQKVEVARGQLVELGKACDYWQQFWTVTIRAAGQEETRRQLKALIEQERSRLQAWMASDKGLGR
ncbi:MAG TPA: hypothetical protein PKE12_02120 [Kiritimatiellia bacterium]|nr:hypothetical protein [Kiritimatiellia bacterium]